MKVQLDKRVVDDAWRKRVDAIVETKVQSIAVIVPELQAAPPPPPAKRMPFDASFRYTLELISVASASYAIFKPPPKDDASFRYTFVLVSVAVPKMQSPPPSPPESRSFQALFS